MAVNQEWRKLGQKMRAARSRLGITEVELADALGYGGTDPSKELQIRRFELGLRKIPEQTWRLFLMFDAYGIPYGKPWRKKNG